jgi:hypothetical protein
MVHARGQRQILSFFKYASLKRRLPSWEPARALRAPALSVRFPEQSEARAKLFGKKLRLFPGSEMTALFHLVVLDEIGIGALHKA